MRDGIRPIVLIIALILGACDAQFAENSDSMPEDTSTLDIANQKGDGVESEFLGIDSTQGSPIDAVSVTDTEKLPGNETTDADGEDLQPADISSVPLDAPGKSDSVETTNDSSTGKVEVLQTQDASSVDTNEDSVAVEDSVAEEDSSSEENGEPCGGCPDETFCVDGSCTNGRYSFVETVIGPSSYEACKSQSDPNQPVCWPMDLEVSPLGKLYVADGGNHRVRLLENDILSTVAGQGIAGDLDGPLDQALFDQPTGIALEGESILYVVDYGNHKIRKISDGAVETFAGTGEAGYVDGPVSSAQFNEPLMIALGPEGALYVTDTKNARIRKIHNGEVSTVAGSGLTGYLDGNAEDARFGSVSGIAVDAQGRIFVADSMAYRIRMIHNGMVTTLAGSMTPEPPCETELDCVEPGAICYANICRPSCADTGICVDDQVCVSGACITPIQGWMEGEGHQARFGQPRGMDMDPSGNLFVADFINHRIRIIRTNDPVYVQSAAGTGGYQACTADTDCCTGQNCPKNSCSYGYCQELNFVGKPPPIFGGYEDGSTDIAKFEHPAGVTVDPTTGRLYVSDMLNQAIRLVLP